MMMHKDETVVVLCTICSNPTPYTGTKKCNRCWELDSRIRMDPDIAKKIIASL